jgi:hypothetical protein
MRYDKSILLHKEQDTYIRALWQAWPIVLLVALASLVFGFKVVAWGYQRSVQEFAVGVKQRQEKNLDLDLARLQEEP